MESLKLTTKWMAIIAAGLLSACGAGTPGDDGVVGTGFTVSGAAQKGPLILGSTVTINVLSGDGNPTSETIVTHTTDDIGNFSFEMENQSAVQISVQGYHFNEITGRFSDSMLTLRAIYDINGNSQQSAFVNVLTHLIHNRVIKKIKEGDSATSAIILSQTEFIEAFKAVLNIDSIPDFTSLSVYDINQNSDGNAYLLSLSSVVYQYAISKSKLNDSSVDAELSFVLNKMSADFAEDGEIKDAALINDLVSASRLLRPDKIEENLVLHSYLTLGHVLDVPEIDKFIDTDGDGEVNIKDNDDDNDGIIDIEDPEPYGVNTAEIQVTKPSNGATLSGVTTIEGTANEFTEFVKIKIGDGPFIEAIGTTNWSLDIDTEEYFDGDTEITVQAVQSDWGYTEKKVLVSIENIDPIVGTWSCTNKNGWTYDDQWFYQTGAMNDSVFSCWVSGWERQGNDIIVHRSNCSDQRFTPTFSEDLNTMQINEGTYAAPLSCQRK